MNKHELKHKMKSARLRFNRAVTGNPLENAIRQTVQCVIAEGGDPVEACEAGIKMCTKESLEVKIGNVVVRWGDKA